MVKTEEFVTDGVRRIFEVSVGTFLVEVVNKILDALRDLEVNVAD
jgi:hypothetical protein